MTTHDKNTDIPATLDTEGSPPQAEATPAAETAPPQPEVTPPPQLPASEPATDTTTDDSLFADDDRSGLRSRWDQLQAAFVDDPKQCVEKADDLVSEVVSQLTAGFSDARSRLEAQWSRGEEASTEDLRVTLTRYRDFFQRLLSV